MKKLTVVLMLAGISMISMVGTGCSSAQPKADAPAIETPAPAPAPAVKAPVDLGASSAGRGR